MHHAVITGNAGDDKKYDESTDAWCIHLTPFIIMKYWIMRKFPVDEKKCARHVK